MIFRLDMLCSENVMLTVVYRTLTRKIQSFPKRDLRIKKSLILCGLYIDLIRV